MGFRYRKRVAFGPLRVNVTDRGVTSYAIKLGPFTWNLNRKKLTTDLPGALRHEYQAPKRRRVPRAERVRMCACQHEEAAHEHYRAGTECSLCSCPSFDFRRYVQ